ncbi:MAG: DUF1217 domain-containing protein, partial [Bosea sp. (in: a-proteobacteria)]
YLKTIGSIKTIDAFMADDRLYRYAMKAFGLGDMAYAKGLIRKVLTEGVDSPSAFANRLSDSRYRELASVFNFKRYNTATTSFESTQKPVTELYIRQVFEEEQGSQDENVRLALYFQRKAPGLSNPVQLLADKALLKVVQTALGLSPLTSTMPIEKQMEMIGKRLDVKSLQDPAALDKFLRRFAALADSGDSSAATSQTTLLFGGRASAGISTDLLFSIQKLRLGGL